ncbi:MAG: DUF6115 domain-containing protein [Alkalispirochaetaceae bacterium]
MTLLVTLAFNAFILGIIYLLLNRKVEKNITPEAFLEKVRSEVQSVIVELNDTTDRNVTILEERVRSLQAVMKRSEKQLTLLQREVEKHRESSEVYTHLRKAGRIVSTAKGETGSSSTKAGVATGVAEGSEAGGGSSAGEAEPPLEQRVINLHNQGIAPASIASRLKRTTGEVELIISLYERKEWA